MQVGANLRRQPLLVQLWQRLLRGVQHQQQLQRGLSLQLCLPVGLLEHFAPDCARHHVFDFITQRPRRVGQPRLDLIGKERTVGQA